MASDFCGCKARRKLSSGYLYGREKYRHDGSRYDAEADQQHESEEPPGVKYVGQPARVQYAERLRGVGALHLVGLGDRPLKHDCSGRRENHDQDQQNHAGLDGSNGAPRFVGECA